MSEKRKDTTVTRENLYALVWSSPVSRLAKDFGISDRGLAKLCARMEIPVPPRGYWAKPEDRRKKLVLPLPERKPNIPESVMITPTPPSKPPARLPNVAAEVIAKYDTQMRQISVPARLTNPHPLVSLWLKENKERVNQYRDKSTGWRPGSIVDTPLKKRRLCILIALFKELERLGYHVRENKEYPRNLRVEIADQEVAFELDEHIRQRRYRLTPEEKADRYYAGQEWRQVKEPTGNLRFRIMEKSSLPGVKTDWIESEADPIEDHLTEIMASLIAAAAILGEQKKERLLEQQRRQEEESRRYENERRLKRDAARWRHVLGLVERSREAKEAQDFLDRLVAQVRAENDEADLPDEIMDWIKWARSKAEAHDPLRYSLKDIVGANLEVNEYTYR